MGGKPRCILAPRKVQADLADGRHLLELCLRPRVGALVKETVNGQVLLEEILPYKEAYELYIARRKILVRSIGR